MKTNGSKSAVLQLLTAICVIQSVLVGCARADSKVATTLPSLPARVEKVTWTTFQNAYRISNADAEAIVVPEIGRVMSFKLTGRRNVLWTTEGVLPTPQFGTWRNWGGEKAWIWPQSEWPKAFGSDWPPPSEAAVDVEPIEGGVRWKTPGVDGFGVRVWREITLAPAAATLTTATWLEAAPEVSRKIEAPLAPWTIVQVPATDRLVARRAGPQAYPFGWKPMNPNLFKSITPVGTDVLVLRRPKDASPKVGLDADLLAAVYDDLLVVVKDVSKDPTGFAPSERAQIYAQEDFADSAGGAYIELEFVAPSKPMSEFANQRLVNTIQIEPLVKPADGQKTAAWLASLVRDK